MALVFLCASLIAPCAFNFGALMLLFLQINLPFGACAFIAVALFFTPPKRKTNNLSFRQKVAKIDIIGAIFLICAIVCLLLALQWGGTQDPWKASKIWGLFLGFGLMIIIFIVIQFWRGDEATIPPRIFLRQRTILTGSLFSCLLGMGLYTHIFYLPFYFQAVKGVSAEQSGIRSIPYLVSITLMSLLVGVIITKVGYYVPAMWFGAAVMAIGSGLLFTLTVSTSASKWIGYQILTGFGAGAGIQVPFLAVQAVLSSQDMPVGSASSFPLPSFLIPSILTPSTRCNRDLLQLSRRRHLHLRRPKRLRQYPRQQRTQICTRRRPETRRGRGRDEFTECGFGD